MEACYISVYNYIGGQYKQDHDWTAILIRCCMNKFKLTSSLWKMPSATIWLLAWLLYELGLTLTLIFLSLVSFGLVMKNLGMGNLSCIMNLASSMGDSRRPLKLPKLSSL